MWWFWLFAAYFVVMALALLFASACFQLGADADAHDRLTSERLDEELH